MQNPTPAQAVVRRQVEQMPKKPVTDFQSHCDLCGHADCISCCDTCSDPECPNNQGCPVCSGRKR